MATFASVIVNGGVDYRTESAGATGDRLASLARLVELLAGAHPEVEAVLFPAGYFCTPRPSQVAAIANRVAGRIAELDPPFTVIWGIDGWTDESKRDVECGAAGHPFFAFAKRPGDRQVCSFQQTTTSAAEGRSEELDGRWDGRSVTIHGTRTALLICGECLSGRLMDRVRAARPDVLLIPAHRNVNLSGGKSRRSWHPRLTKFHRDTGIPVVLSEHSRSPWRHPYSWGGTPAGEVNLPAALAGRFTVKLTEV